MDVTCDPIIAAAYQRLIAQLRTPCRCDPPGSGAFCNHVCRVRAALAQRLEQRVVWGNAGVLALFDEAIAEVIALESRS